MPTDDVSRPTAHDGAFASTSDSRAWRGAHHAATAGVARAVVALAALAALAAAVPTTAAAQMLATPVLQSAFVDPGLTAAANFGSTSGARAYGLAASWAPRNGRLSLTAGVGVFDPSAAGSPSRATYGARVAVPVRQFMDGALGVAAFAGIGGASKKEEEGRVTSVPAGVAVGYRRALGSALGLAVHAAPFYSWTRGTAADGSSTSSGLFRVSGGADLSLAQHFSVTFGVEVGAEAKGSDPGPRSSVFGIGLSYAFQ